MRVVLQTLECRRLRVVSLKREWRDRFQTLEDPVAERQRILAWKAAWEDQRNGRFSARGDRTKHGNPLLRVTAEGDR